MRFSTLLVLDFDGVICDSIDECFASSWVAYHELYREAGHVEPSAKARQGFARLRPFIRTGEDFVLVQEMLARGDPVSDQGAFDAAARRAGEATRALYRDLFYRARSDMLARDRERWLALNRIYPHVEGALAALPRGVPLVILSTKKPGFVAEILRAHRIALPHDQFVWSDREPKLETVERQRVQWGLARAVLVEDQIDAIVGNRNPWISVYLATWGYVKEEWLAQPTAVPILSPEGFLELMEEILSGS